jgi:hypothetical protein
MRQEQMQQIMAQQMQAQTEGQQQWMNFHP